MPIDLEKVAWIHGSSDCALSADPLLQVVQYDCDTYILRVSKCYSFEGNFLYLLCGDETAVLFDTGGAPDRGNAVLPVRETVDRILDERQRVTGKRHVKLIIAHTHDHGDHGFWDDQFRQRPDAEVVGSDLASVMAFFGLTQWPDGESSLQLGDRLLTVMPLPGHDPAHIAVHDERTGILLTGDTLYPGLLTVRDWPAYRRSAERLARFVDSRSVSHVLGCHVEMKRAAGQLYRIGTTFQPDERALPLTAGHVREWHAACEAMGATPRRDVHADFIIEPL